MAQYVFEFGGADLAAVADALTSWLGIPASIEVAKEQPGGPDYQPTSDGLPNVLDRLRTRALSSAILRSGKPDLRYGLILAPHFNGQPLSQWMGTLESTDSDWKPMWDTVLKNDRLQFASLGFEEGVDLTDDHLTVDTFPWNEWPMVIGALRDADGKWIIRESVTRVRSF